VHQAKPKAKRTSVAAVGGSTWLPRPPDAPATAAVAPVTASVASVSVTSSNLLPLLLGIALALSLIVVAVAATPPWVLPRHVNMVAYEHREAVMTGGTAIAVSIAVGLLIALVGS
jgi:hypothetical protein